MLILILSVYLFFCLLVASAAKNVTVGFWGVLVISILLTPILTAILVLVLRPKPNKKKRRGMEDLDLEEDY